MIRIEQYAFFRCESLVYIKLSINLEYIGQGSFYECNLFSVFIPPTCRDIDGAAFYLNKNLSILSVPQHVELGRDMIQNTKLAKSSPFEVSASGETFTLHRACLSFQPL